MRSTFNVLFYLKKNAPKKNGKVPIMVRITIDGKVAQFSSKLDIDVALWDIHSGKAMGKSLQAQDLNRALDGIRMKINRHYQEIRTTSDYITAEKVKNVYLGLHIKHQTLLQLFADHNRDFSRQVGKIKSKATYLKYCCVYKHLEAFIHTKYHSKDILLREITPGFITEFELFLRTEKSCSTNTVWIYMMPLRKMISIALNNQWITRNPFMEYRLSPENTQRGYLNLDELKLLMNASFPKKGHELVKNLFIFCCFTGLSYSDLKNLTTSNVQTSFDGKRWLITKRQKTGVPSNIRLLEIPLKILEQYGGRGKGNKLFHVPAYSSLRVILKNITIKCGIHKHVTWHMARHTYATVICLTNGVPIETVSALLGHSNIRTTQIYAKITNEKVSRDMEALSLRLQSIEQFLNQGPSPSGDGVN